MKIRVAVRTCIAHAVLAGAAPAAAAKPPKPDTTAPTVPTNVRITAATEDTVSVAWNASTDNSGSIHHYVTCYSGTGSARRSRACRPNRAERSSSPRSAHARRAVAALLAACGATCVTLSATREERELGAHYRAVLATAGGKYLAARELRDAAGAKRGVVFAYQGDQSWVTVVLDDGAADDGPWRVGSRCATAPYARLAASTPRRPARSGVTRCRSRCASSPPCAWRPRAARGGA